MSAETAALFPDSFSDSERGPIPLSWSAAPFSDLVEIHGGGTPKTSVSDYWGGAIPWFSVADTPVTGDVFVLTTEKRITELGLAQSAARLLPTGATIITARGTVGNLAVVGYSMAMNQSCYALIGKNGFGPFFIHFMTREVVDELRQRTHGTVFETITRETFETVQVTYPDVRAAGVFEVQVSPIMEAIKANLEESRTLAPLRDPLLPKFLSGAIRVKQAERVAGGNV
jgi:type I restriction enzyme S subunit